MVFAKQNNNDQTKTKTKTKNHIQPQTVAELNAEALPFCTPDLHSLPHLAVLVPCKVISRVFHASRTPRLAKASLRTWLDWGTLRLIQIFS